jgi:hypothetical protein
MTLQFVEYKQITTPALYFLLVPQSTDTESIMSSMAIYTSELDPPPPYEELATTASIEDNNDAATSNEDKCHVSNEWNPVSRGRDRWLYYRKTPLSTGFWFKSILDMPSMVSAAACDKLAKIDFGISRHLKDSEPDCVFTCHLLPRTPTIQKHVIGNLCANIARVARSHRGNLEEYCECTFKDLRDGVKCHKGGRWAYRLSHWHAAWVVRRWMRRHDNMCRCGCFDTYLTNSGLPL